MPEHSTLYGHMAIFAMQLLSMGYQWLREGRQHRWQEEQRREMAGIRADIKNGHA